MAQPATKAPKLSKDEIWYEKRFSVKIAKLDPEFVEGGKKYSKFQSDLGTFKMIFTLLENRFADVKKLKIDPKDKSKARVMESLPKDYKALEAMAKKADFKSTKKALMELNGDIGSLTSKDGVTVSPELDHSIYAGGSSR